MLSLDTLPESDVAWEAVRALRGIERKRLRAPAGSKIPVLARNRCALTPRRESPLGEEAFEEIVDEFMPLESKFQAQQILRQDVQRAFENLKQRLRAAEEELRSFQEKPGEDTKQEAEISPEVEATNSHERLIQRLARCLRSKEGVLQDCLIILQSLGTPGVKPSMLEVLIKQMAHRLKERDQALEKTLSSHFLALESVHRELRHLQEALKDKDSDLARLSTALRTGEETLHALREVLHQKDREIQRLESLSTSTRGSWEQRDQTLLLVLKEKEALIQALQEALASSTKDVEALANSLGSPDFAPGLLQRIQEKEDLLARSLAEQEEIRAQWQRRLQAMEDAAAVTEQELQEQLRRHSQDARERAQEAEELRRRLTQAEAELARGAAALEEFRAELARLQEMEAVKEQVLEEALREAEEKDRILQKLQELWLKRMKPVAGAEVPGQILLPPPCSPLAPD